MGRRLRLGARQRWACAWRRGAVSSVVERLLYTERVGGSKPSPLTPQPGAQIAQLFADSGKAGRRPKTAAHRPPFSCVVRRRGFAALFLSSFDAFSRLGGCAAGCGHMDRLLPPRVRPTRTAGGKAAESVSGEQKTKRKERGGATPSDDTRNRRTELRLFWSPADLARVRARHARWPRCGVAAPQHLPPESTNHEPAMKL